MLRRSDYSLFTSLRVCAIALTSIFFSMPANAANYDVLGHWQTIDDETGKAKSIVEIFRQGDSLSGRITKIMPRPGLPDKPICKKCTDHRKDQEIRGMVILEGLVADGDKWNKGTILDPQNGKTYRCSIWMENGQLKVRGYVGVFFRTQTWNRVDG